MAKPEEDSIKFSDFVEILSSQEPTDESKRLIKKRLKFTANSYLKNKPLLAEL